MATEIDVADYTYYLKTMQTIMMIPAMIISGTIEATSTVVSSTLTLFFAVSSSDSVVVVISTGLGFLVAGSEVVDFRLGVMTTCLRVVLSEEIMDWLSQAFSSAKHCHLGLPVSSIHCFTSVNEIESIDE